MLSNTCKYAIRSLIYIAKFSSERKRIGIKKISEDLDIPSPFLGKILQNLARKKLLVSTKGPNGGFSLSKMPEEVSLFEIIEMVEGDDYFNNCLIRLESCKCIKEKNKPLCPIHNRFAPVRKSLIEFYSNTTLAQVVDDYDHDDGKMTL